MIDPVVQDAVPFIPVGAIRRVDGDLWAADWYPHSGFERMWSKLCEAHAVSRCLGILKILNEGENHDGQRPEQAPPAQRFRPLPKPFRAFRNEPLPALRLSRSNILSCQAMYIAYLRSDDVVAWWATMTEPAIRICISTCQGDAGERSTAPEMRLPARAMDDHWTHVGAGCLR